MKERMSERKIYGKEKKREIYKFKRERVRFICIVYLR